MSEQRALEDRIQDIELSVRALRAFVTLIGAHLVVTRAIAVASLGETEEQWRERTPQGGREMALRGTERLLEAVEKQVRSENWDGRIDWDSLPQM